MPQSSRGSAGVAKATFGNLRFGHGSSARYDSDFPTDQSWVKSKDRICTEFADELPELEEIYAVIPDRNNKIPANVNTVSDTPRNLPAVFSSGSTAIISTTPDIDTPWTPRSVYSRAQPSKSPSKRRRTNESESSQFLSHTQFSSNLIGQGTSSHERSESLDETSRIPDQTEDATDSLLEVADQPEQNAAQVVSLPTLTPRDTGQSYTINVQPDTPGIWPYASVQEACLMRYLIHELACWFDLCDLERHFALVVPQRARHCPALLNAIYTASARHLSHLDQYRKEDAVEYFDKRLADLHIETAVEYHSRCIEHLVSVSDDPEAVFDENLLAASIILRLYEKIDAHLNGGDWETGLRGTQVLIEAQASSGL